MPCTFKKNNERKDYIEGQYMIDFLKGRIESISAEAFIIDLGSIGFEICCSAKTAGALKQAEERHVYIHLLIKEDDMQLFGFLSKEERHMFRLLITVSGIGPKAAVAILSTYVPGELAMHIVRENQDALTNVRGIGKKNAGRLILELKDKINKMSKLTDAGIILGSAGQEPTNEQEEAYSALLVLGYSDRDIRRVLTQLDIKDMSIEQILKEALKIL